MKSPLTSKASHRCAKCGHDNPAATKFCGECGAPISHEDHAVRACYAALREQAVDTCVAPEVPRLEGQLLARLPDPDLAGAERCVREAIACARKQESRSLELRAATSLASMLLQQGRRDEARTTLAEIYGWFTEGHDTADLVAARAMLAECTNG